MFENDANSSPSQNDEHSNSSTEYLRLASQACASGDAVLGMHLYLAAFERAQHGEGSAVDEAALEGLKQAWQLACKLKERSIAEYAFERLEPRPSPRCRSHSPRPSRLAATTRTLMRWCRPSRT